MNTERGTFYDSPSNDFPTNINVDHNRQLHQVVYLPVETSQLVYIQPNDGVQEQSLPLYTTATPDNGSTAGNRYHFCSAPSNLSYNSDGCSYHHVSVGALSRALRRSSFSPYHPQLISSHRPNIIQTNLYEQDLSDDGNSYSFGAITYAEHEGVFATQNIEDGQVYPNTVFSSLDNTQSDDDQQHRSNFLEHSSSNVLSCSSTEESAVSSIINSQSLYFPDELPMDVAVDHNIQLSRVVYLPVETLQPVYIQPNDGVREQSLPLYTRATPDNGSTAGNRYHFCSAPSNLSYNSDGCSYHHVSVGALSRALRRRSFSPYHPQLISSHIPNIIQTNLYEQDLSYDGNSYSFGAITYAEHEDVFATQNIEDGQMYPNTVFSSLDNTQSNDDQQHRSNFLEYSSSNILSCSSTEESAVSSIINSQSLYFPDELPMDVAVENQFSSSHSASNSSSLGESQFGQSHSITEQDYQRPSSYLSTYPTQEIADIRLAVSPLHHCSGNNVGSNQVSSSSPSNSALVAENQFKKSRINEEQYSPSSSNSVHANTVQVTLAEASSVTPPSHHPSGAPLSSDSASKDDIHCFSTLYREVQRELCSASNRDVFNYINTPPQYACNELTETSTAIQEAMMQPSSSVESTDKLPTELFCKEQYSPSSSNSVHANTVQVTLAEASSVAPPSHHPSGAPPSSDSASKDNIHCFSTLYREVQRGLCSASNGDTFNYINTPAQYACNELTETSKAIQEAMMQPSSSLESTDTLPTELFCKFCYKNREPAFIFRSHQLKNENGIVTCPVLRKYSCPLCGATGDFSHTVSYCPLAENNNATSESFQEGRQSRELE